MPCSLFIAVLFSLYRYLLFLSLLYRFLFYRENRSLFYANSQTFSFCVKIPLFSLSNFSIQQAFLTLQRYYFCVLYFSFSLWKSLSVPYGFRLIYAPLHPMLLSFLFAWNFLAISSAKALNLLYFYVVSFSFVPYNFLFSLWKSLSFQPKEFFSPVLTLTSFPA